MGGWNKGGNNNKGGGGQRYHKGRSDMVVPGVTGILVSVEPSATGKAIREMKLLLDPFKPASAIEAEKKAAAAEAAAAATAASSSSNAAASSSDAAAAPTGGASSLAAMLAEELDSFRRPEKPELVVANMTGVADEENGADGDASKNRNAGPKGPRRPFRQFRKEWFTTLETNCKGYVFVNIPKMAAAEGEDEEDADVNADGEEKVEGEPAAKQARTEEGAAAATAAGGDAAAAATASSSTAVAPTAATAPDNRFLMNPLVTEVAESLMESLAANPRPVTRFTFRMIPVEASCNPTLPCILGCAKQLCDTLEVPSGRSVIRIGVVINVKNNTSFAKEKGYIKAAVEASLPKSRFAVFGYWNTNWAQEKDADGTFGGKFLIEVDAVLHIFVAHSTCCMGLQRNMTVEGKRRMYNLHDFAAGTMALGAMASKEVAPAPEDEKDAEAEVAVEEAPTPSE